MKLEEYFRCSCSVLPNICCHLETNREENSYHRLCWRLMQTKYRVPELPEALHWRHLLYWGHIPCVHRFSSNNDCRRIHLVHYNGNLRYASGRFYSLNAKVAIFFTKEKFSEYFSFGRFVQIYVPIADEKLLFRSACNKDKIALIEKWHFFLYKLNVLLKIYTERFPIRWILTKITNCMCKKKGCTSISEILLLNLPANVWNHALKLLLYSHLVRYLIQRVNIVISLARYGHSVLWKLFEKSSRV